MSFVTNRIIRSSCKQTAEQNAFVVRSIGGPLNQSSEKAVQLESSDLRPDFIKQKSGGAR
jgi:hypothetical protein